MKVTASAAPNIALIKYWGNRDDNLRLPMADSLSMTLDRPMVEIMVDHAPALTVESFDAAGVKKTLKEKDTARFATHLSLTKRYLGTLGAPDVLPNDVSISIHSRVPSSVGLASSAAVFGCLAKAYAGLIAPKRVLTDKEVSVIARMGSGSAARSIMGGYVALLAGEGSALDASLAEQIAPMSHWHLHDIIIIPSRDEKKTGSTEGHAGAHSSPMYGARIEAIRNRRQKEAVDAILNRDFAKLQAVTEEDCWDMHEVMGTQKPPLEYLSKDTHRIVQGITDLRESEHLEALYTMDAGPTVHVICTDAARDRVVAYANAQNDCTIFETSIGPGARLLS